MRASSSACTTLSASSVPVTALVGIFNEAYRDYPVPMQLTEPVLHLMVRLFSLDLAASRIGLAHGRPVALTLLGLRQTRAWIAGVGVIPAARGRGYGAAITQAAVDEAAARGAREVWLEVLATNVPARHIYERLGFQPVRPLGVWTRAPQNSTAPAVPNAPRHAGVDIAEVDPAVSCAFIAATRTTVAPWQRDTTTLRNGLPYYRGLLASAAGQPAAAVLFSATHEFVDVLEVVSFEVDDNRRHALALLESLIGQFPGCTLRMVNYAEEDPLVELFAAVGATSNWQQIEMCLAL